ncbi:MarR family winged helix-turn-helix transcriptional regulator [Staphylococcus massiliensis]|uniref:MarR family transcriptional regulator n=1 Tax=Staphylococcus massiliensis S46 TaxID=1229783 RepID=K9AM95_9STAP|nr:MarR family transcriptional regulator [Staphylococcus massiliensis]EKU48493.1 MarR family transcriptional regulator [Staphylococcus massiliensis S46]MCG3400384.1 MarR family transcriptional regulator [Staphylococcus massiliensis]MCG3401769.1 MarR family transcriptional regulator [Staphylococcus massiliensis]MCG3412641.1 MarR family transcriptional regulator [Staphylococcus massiliensis]POA01502.1 MarR family transcriptional regulator [Staphylococcus massiliensis CCUG 55927]
MEEHKEHLRQQLCFLFYVSSKEIIKKYTQYLNEFDLTFTGYITLVSIKEDEYVNIKTLGDRIYLNSGTLTPLIKKLEAKSLVKKARLESDERNMSISLTEKGKEVREQLFDVSRKVYKDLDIEDDNAQDLINSLNNLLENNFR